MLSLIKKPMLDLQPREIWQQFQVLCDTPRPSFEEDAIRQQLFDWAIDRNLSAYIDPCGNLLIKKPATPGMQDRATIVLQGHLDIVAQKNSDSVHNFSTDPIQTVIEDGWITAVGTTLGADNGIGVAAALAVLASDDIAHGPIEALFTIEEETSLRGATELESGILAGKILLNLDSEDRGDVYIGCAGGVDINGSKQFETINSSSCASSYEIKICGLRGGHSGLDIHKGIASANVLLARLLYQLNRDTDFSLSSLNGGTLRNAIAREAVATIFCSESEVEKISAIIDRQLSQFKSELKGVDDYLDIRLRPDSSQSSQVLSKTDQSQLINLIYSLPHGVDSMSRDLAGVTHTSNNLGVVTLTQGAFEVCLLARSLEDSKTQAMADKVAACLQLAGLSSQFESPYPGWLPEPNTGLLKQFLEIHQQEMGFAAAVKVIHAGLECGIIGAKYPGMQMVSFGPNIRGAHSPDERLEISSVGDFWRLLVKLLASL
ncbi:MAG: aminoacyl-histidine dipeptidase precursor [Osedax symbiont Rs2]|nr:MAG: aminoacyl-histidine dipeptidase precursor [Osedax symbiont Rs2]